MSFDRANERFVEARNYVRTRIKSWRIRQGQAGRRVKEAQSDASVVANSWFGVVNDLTKVCTKLPQLPPSQSTTTAVAMQRSRSITDDTDVQYHLRHRSSQECMEPRVSERERPGNRAINNYRMKKGARYPPGAPKPRLHTPRHPLPFRAAPASYKPRARARPRQLYPRTRNVLLPWRRMLAYDESGWYLCMCTYPCIDASLRVRALLLSGRSMETSDSTCPTFLTLKSVK